MTENDILFENITETYYAEIYKYLVFCLKDEDRAGDILQDTFVVVYKNIEKLKNHENVGGFVFRTAQNLVKNYKKQLYKRITKELSIDEGIIDIRDYNADIESTMDSRIDEYDYVTDIIESLDDEKKRLYKMYYIENIPMKEIAKSLNIEYTALRMKYVRLRREIKELVKEAAEKYFVT